MLRRGVARPVSLAAGRRSGTFVQRRSRPDERDALDGRSLTACC